MSLFLYFMFLFGLCDCEQRFSDQPSYTEVNPGQKTELKCLIESKGRNSECIWQKDGKPIRMQSNKYELAQGDSSDCSLMVFDANIKYDDGYWQCQVTSSSLDSNDALSSRPAKLVVRVPPQAPNIFLENGRILTSKDNITVRDKTVSRVRCESQGGNPAAMLRWFLDNSSIDEASVQQRNESVRNSNTFNAISTIDTVFNKVDNGKRLRCVSFHPAFVSGSVSTSAILDVQFAPVVSLEHAHNALLRPEADVDEVRVRCAVNANPEADVIWRRDGGQAIFSVGQELSFKPVRIGDGGTYLCQASNKIGRSSQLSFSFVVQFAPRELTISPDQTKIELEVDQRSSFVCAARAEPGPEFEWQISRDDDNKNFVKMSEGNTANLVNVSYFHEGKWRCQVSNTIKGKKRSAFSKIISVNVRGRPRASKSKEQRLQKFQRNEDALIEVHFCADPAPQSTQWSWNKGQTSIKEGENRGRFSAGSLKRESNSDCYRARLGIGSVTNEDEDVYTLQVDNARGSLLFGVKVQVLDPVSMGLVVSFVLVALVLLTVGAVVYVVLNRRRLNNNNNRRNADSRWSRSSTALKTSKATSVRSRGVNKAVSISRPLSTSTPTTTSERPVDVPSDLGLPLGSSSTSSMSHSSNEEEIRRQLAITTLGRKTPQNTDLELSISRKPSTETVLKTGVKVLPVVTSAVISSFYTEQPRKSVIRRQ